MEIRPYTKDQINDVAAFERALREEEPDCYFWEINDTYISRMERSFADPQFDNAVSLLAYADGKVLGRIDAALICSRFDGSVSAYLDWICVLKSARRRGVAQALTEALRELLRKEYAVDTLIALMAGNPEAQRFYRALEHAEIHDEAVWISCK